jgi:hypothetical protein
MVSPSFLKEDVSEFSIMREDLAHTPLVSVLEELRMTANSFLTAFDRETVERKKYPGSQMIEQ